MNGITQDFTEDFTYLADRVFYKKQPTAFVRYADGEMAIMLGKAIKGIDNWYSPANKTLLGKDLIQTLKNNDKDWFVGISCSCCDESTKKILFDNLTLYANVPVSNITYSNLFVNSNYKKTFDLLNQINEKVVVIANKEGMGKKYPFDVIHFFSVEEQTVNNWESIKLELMENIHKNLLHYKDTLFLVSAGPLSEIIIDYLWKHNKTNRYIDIGSALDEFTKGRKTRPYMFANQPFYKQQCNMHWFNREDFNCFVGDWSYTPEEVYLACCSLSIGKKISVLEFGSGDSTKKLYDILTKHKNVEQVSYVCYESDEKYLIKYKNIQCILYNVEDIQQIDIGNHKYDLILIDGPNGVVRKEWYKKLDHNIKPNTIILIDDYDHYEEFEQHLQEYILKKWHYIVISTAFTVTKNKSWKIVKIINSK